MEDDVVVPTIRIVPRIRSAYDGSRVRVGVECEESMTRQSMKNECDINTILARFAKSGLITHVSRGVPTFADVSEVGDYRSALEQVRRAEEWFAGLPAGVRERFENDPAEFLDALHDAGRREELVALGLIVQDEGVKESGGDAIGGPVGEEAG